MIHVSDFVAWDVATWSRALRHWAKVMESKGDFRDKKGLEIGANKGGLSLFFASRFGCQMVCTDYIPPEKARANHQRFDLPAPIQYLQADVLQIPFSEASFDFVVFKSLLGVVGSHGRAEQIALAIQEIHRVLKPGGILFFAENLRGTVLHVFARRRFVSWGKHWHYLSLKEIEAVLSGFSETEIQTTGFLSAFVTGPEWLKNLVAGIDRGLFFLPSTWRYVAYGHAVK